MARLQILELPEGAGDDRPPFILVVDQALPARQVMVSGQIRVRSEWDMLAEEIGARGVVVTAETIDIPANDTTAYLQQVAEETGATIGKITSAYTAQTLADERTDITRDMYRLAKWKQKLSDALGIDRASNWDDICTTASEFRSELIRSENARDRLRQDRDEARSWARHGYEIGQKHCGWTDHGVAPTWLTENWPPHIESCEHLKQAAELDDALSRVRNLPEAPESMSDQHPSPADYLQGYGVAIREAKRTTYRPEQAESPKQKRDWCCSLAFQTLDKQHNGDCPNADA